MSTGDWQVDFGKKTIVWIIHPETEGESCAYCTNFGASIPFRDFFCYIIIKEKFGRGGIVMSSKTTAFTDVLQDSPVIAAVKNDAGLARALESECAVIFFLYGTILNIPQLVRKAKEKNKLAFVHADLIEGMSGKDISADFLARNTTADGIISTRPNLIRRARELGLITIQRFFLLDSMSFENVLRQSSNADVVDILPGTMPQIIRRLTEKMPQPLIASGLLQDKSDVMAALSAGAIAISTTDEALWFV